MKRIIFLSCLAALLFLACGRSPVGNYTDEVMDSYDRTQELADTASLQAIERHIKTYRALNDKYPESIEALANSVGPAFDPGKYDYDPDTGSISLR